MDKTPLLGTLVAGGKKVVAAVTWDNSVTVWSTQKDMDEVASYQALLDREKGIIEEIQVTSEDKVVIHVHNYFYGKSSAAADYEKNPHF